MNKKIIPCVEGDDEFVAEKINEITDSKIVFEDSIEDELVVFKINDNDDNIIAGCNLIVNSWKIADLDILWVDENYRRQGIGSALITEAIRVAKEKGCQYMTLGTFDFQARPLYEKFGFSVCGVIENCPSEGHTHYDMIKQLDGDVSVAPIAFEIKPGDEDDGEYIDDKLVEYNWSQVPAVNEFEWIGNKTVDDDGNLVGGCFVGVNFWNLAFVDMIWVDEENRNQGVGSELLAKTEQEAEKCGATLAMLDAREWNVEFFKKQGYSVYCTLENYPTGYTKYKMLKRFTDS